MINYRIGMLVILMLSFGAAQAQFVSFRLEIPAGATFTSQVVDPMNGGSWEKSRAMTWIELKLPENQALLLDIHYAERIIEPPLEFYFLNNGTSNFEEANLLTNSTQTVVMTKSGKLTRNRIPRSMALSAWLGLPMAEGINIKIEYP